MAGKAHSPQPTGSVPENIGVLDTLLLVSELFQQDMARYFRGSGLTKSRVGVLWVLQAGGPCTQQSIASALGTSARNVSGLVDALEVDGFVRRSPHPGDRRAVLVELTPRSSKLMSRMRGEHDRLDATLTDAVAPGDIEAFRRGLHAVADRLHGLVAATRGDDDGFGRDG